jgi:hypothetical protein
VPEVAAELAAGQVGTGRGPAGASGTGSALNPLVRRLVVGSCGTGRDAAPTAHNPEVEGSNPSPATRIDQHVWRFTSSQKDSRMWLLSVICQWRARASVRAFLLG